MFAACDASRAVRFVPDTSFMWEGCLFAIDLRTKLAWTRFWTIKNIVRTLMKLWEFGDLMVTLMSKRLASDLQRKGKTQRGRQNSEKQP